MRKNLSGGVALSNGVNMELIKDTVQKVIQILESKKKGLSAIDPQALLRKALTKKELSHIKFNYFRRGVLNIIVDSSGWLYQLSLQKEDLLSKLNKEQGSIKDIRFRLGEVR